MNGILLINKPKEYTSHDIVAIVKKLSKEKVGHTGTLDPMATGVLPLLIGKATGISKYLINHDKIYIATVKLGKKTDTADAEGKVIEEKSVPQFSKDDVIDAIQSIIGKQKQIPPMYSAVKVNGKKLYEYARSSKTVEVEPRNIEIYNAEFISINGLEITFKLECSKGTYVRTVCEDLAEKLNTVGYMKELKRIKVGNFNIEDSINIEDIKNNENLLKQNIICLEDFFADNEKLELNERELYLFLNGVMISKKEKERFI